MDHLSLVSHLLATITVPAFLVIAGWIFKALIGKQIAASVARRPSYMGLLGILFVFMAIGAAALSVYFARTQFVIQKSIVYLPMPKFLPKTLLIPAPRLSLGVALLFSSSMILLPLSALYLSHVAQLQRAQNSEGYAFRLRDLNRTNESLFWVGFGIGAYKIVTAFQDSHYVQFIAILIVSCLFTSFQALIFSDLFLFRISESDSRSRYDRSISLNILRPFINMSVLNWLMLTIIAWY